MTPLRKNLKAFPAPAWILWTLAWSFGLLAGPALGTVVYQWNKTVLWAACGVLGSLSAALLLLQPRSQPLASQP